jgi:Trypsin-like peptidase domain/FHA domain
MTNLTRIYYLAVLLAGAQILLSGFVTKAVAQGLPVDEWERSIVRVWNVTNGGRGTGWIVSSDGTKTIIATNEHVIRGTRQVQIQIAGTSEDETISAEILWKDRGRDLAILEVDAFPAPAFALHTNDADRGMNVHAVGYPGLADEASGSIGNRVSVYSGVVAVVVTQTQALGPSRRIIQHDVQVNRGNSGGPLLDNCGRVYGVTSEGRAPVEGHGDRLTFSVHIEELARQLEAQDIAFNIDNASCEIGSDDITYLYYLVAGLMAMVLVLFMRKPRQQIVNVIESAGRTMMRRKQKAQEKTHIVGVGANQAKDKGPRLRLSGVLGDGEPIRIDLEYDTIKNAANGLHIGRDDYANEFAIADDSVSRRHARVSWAEEAVMLEDMDSTNGTFVNDRPLAAFQPQPIKEGDKIRIGTVEFAVKLVP